MTAQANTTVLFVEANLKNLVPELDLDFKCYTGASTNPLIPKEPTGYVLPAVNILRMTVLWIINNSLSQGLLITGETGTGKTELVMSLAARFNLPLARVECNASMTPDRLDGGTALVSTTSGIVTQFQLSDVAKIYRDGGIILLDEVDKASDEVCERLHAIIDGKPITITDTGEVIYKHPMAKVIGTSNTVGDGTSLRYITSRKWDEAFRARWACISLAYLSPDKELEMLVNRFPTIAKGFLELTVQLANECRNAALGQERDGNVKKPMMSIFSTRVLVNWLKTMTAFGGSAALSDSLNFSFRNMLSNADRLTFDSVFQHVSGFEMNNNQLVSASQWVSKFK